MPRLPLLEMSPAELAAALAESLARGKYRRTSDGEVTGGGGGNLLGRIEEQALHRMREGGSSDALQAPPRGESNKLLF